jgi:hypothetical protein
LVDVDLLRPRGILEGALGRWGCIIPFFGLVDEGRGLDMEVERVVADIEVTGVSGGIDVSENPTERGNVEFVVTGESTALIESNTGESRLGGTS